MKKDKTHTLLKLITNSLIEKKATKVLSIDFTNIENALFTYFVICSGSSSTHVEALAQFIEKEVRENLSWKIFGKEGYQNAQWIILDYLDVVVHIFQPYYRDFFRLEELWADAPIQHYESELIKE